MSSRAWQIQEAKADFSSLIRAAERDGPQMITRHGKTVAVLVSQEVYVGLTRAEFARRGSLLSFLEEWPAFEIPERDAADLGRDIEL